MEHVGWAGDDDEDGADFHLHYLFYINYNQALMAMG